MLRQLTEEERDRIDEEWEQERKLKRYERLKDHITTYFDRDFEIIESHFHNASYPNSKYIYVTEMDDKDNVLKIVRTHLRENYTNNSEYSDWTFDLNEETLIIKVDNEPLRQEKERRREEALNARINGYNDHINKLKEDNYKGTINVERDDRNYYDRYILPDRNDVKKVNEGQYKIIYDDKPVNNLNFEIKANKPFYEDSEELKEPLKRFLTESNKVHINPDMFFIPFRYKQRDDKFYILVINNILENIELYQLNSLNHLNKQHNLYYVIGTNMDGKFKGELDKFKDHVILSCQKSTNGNRDLLYEVYSRISHFKDDKFIVKQYH
jgi:hypothetical protein